MSTRPQSTVNHDLLLDIEEASRAWRAASSPSLSERYVAGEGDNPRVMLIGEAPGAQEDMRLRPFVGPSGRVLRELMAIAGIYTGFTPQFGTANCWLTNVVKHRPPRNRKPLDPEIDAMRPLLRKEWTAVGKPRVIIPVGGVALRAVLGSWMSVTKTSGKPMIKRSKVLNGQSVAVWPMIHPAYALRNKGIQPVVEADWERLGGWLTCDSRWCQLT